MCACLNCVHAHSQVWCLFIVLFYLFRFGSRPVIIVYSFSNFLINNDICIDLCTVIGLSRGVLQCNSRSSGKQLITLDRIEHGFMSFSLFKMCARAIDFLSCTHKGGSFEQHWHFRTHILILQRVPCVCVCVALTCLQQQKYNAALCIWMHTYLHSKILSQRTVRPSIWHNTQTNNSQNGK